MRVRAAWMLACVTFAGPCAADTDVLEPPPEAGQGIDYVVEPADTLRANSVEVGFGAWARPGGTMRRTRRVRFRGEGFRGNVRDGAGDPLRGGVIESRIPGGVLTAGRLAPRWGRGLVLGTPADPWSGRALDRGRSSYRGRAGDGLWWRAGSREQLQLMAGRFGRRGIAGVSWQGSRLALGAVSDARRRVQISISFALPAGQSEVAADEQGRWRAELSHRRRVGAWLGAAHVRAGAAAFRSLAEPLRSGPAQALTVGADRPHPNGSARVVLSVWRFAAALTGARAAVRADHVSPGGRIAAGLEAQRGIRRFSGSRIPRARGPRQGAWVEWASRVEAVSLGLRQELWGERGLARSVRRVSGIRVELQGPARTRLRVSHTVFRTAFAENLYVREIYSDRLVLRALTGHGRRTRIALRLPAAGGTLDMSMDLTSARRGPPRAIWTLDWSRRARTRR